MIIGKYPNRNPANCWRIETTRHRWSIRLYFWLYSGNVLRLNRQPRFTELSLGRCVVLCHSKLGGWTIP